MKWDGKALYNTMEVVIILCKYMSILLMDYEGGKQ